jgi:PAS domain S-box-containing protein
MDATGYAVFGLTGIIAALLAVLMFAVYRLVFATRHARRSIGESRAETMLLATALEDAIRKIREQERASTARAVASERLNSDIVASLTSGLIVVDRTGIVRIVNPAACRILGLSAADGMSYVELLAGLGALRDLIAESLATRSPILRRTVAVERSGAVMHLGVTVSPLSGDEGEAGAICLFRDLTSVVALEEQLRLKEALAVLGELTAGLAHEFRNGLATIHGYARLLDPAQMAATQQAYLEGIRNETHALGEVVSKFLEFARPGPMVLAPVDLASVLRRAADDVPGVALSVDGRFALVDGDELLLRQAASNLFRNSFEACEAAGRRAEIAVSGAIDDESRQLIVTVADNGPGLPVQGASRLFQPFFTTRPGGTGLGLAIVQRIIVGHNGRIVAGNRAEGGAIFTLTLPLRSIEIETEP